MPRTDRPQGSWIPRLPAMAAAATSGSILLLARWLEPAAAGHSTHLQLGMAPCTFLDWTGVPCPMCGATTTFALMADGRWGDALYNQPFATLLFLATVVVFAVSIVEIVDPRSRWNRIGRAIAQREAMWLGFSFLALFAGWIWKISIMAR